MPMPNFPHIPPFRPFMPPMSLPAVYGDELSYMELLGKVEKWLSDLVESNNLQNTAIVALYAAWQEFKDGGYLDDFETFLDQWFADNQEHIDELLTGEFGAQFREIRAIADAALAIANTKATLIDETVTYTVGTGQDYTTINAALKDVCAKHNGKDARVTLALVNYVMNEQVVCDGEDMGWIRILSETPITVNGNSISDVTIYIPSHFEQAIAISARCAFTALNGGVLPELDFDATCIGTRRILVGCAFGGGVCVRDGHTFDNFTTGLYIIENSWCNAGATTITNTDRCVAVFRTSQAMLWGCTFSNSEQAIYVDSDSRVELSGCTCTSITDYAARLANSSTCVIERMSFDGIGTFALQIEGNAVVYGNNITIANATTGIRVTDSRIVCGYVTLSGCDTGIIATRASVMAVHWTVTTTPFVGDFDNSDAVLDSLAATLPRIDTHAIYLRKSHVKIEGGNVTGDTSSAVPNTSIVFELAKESTLELHNSTIEALYKAIVAARSTVIIMRGTCIARNTAVEGNEQSTILLNTCTLNALSRCIVIDSSTLQAYNVHPSASYEYNRFINATYSDVTVRTSEIAGLAAQPQITIQRGTLRIRNTSISNGTHGVSADHATIEIDQCTMVGFTTNALRLANSSARLNESTFQLVSGETSNSDIYFTGVGNVTMASVTGGTSSPINTVPVNGGYYINRRV